ncbi:MAG: glycosyltransferase family protein [Desulfobulbaceae bacterium]|jgi:GT2 family glycosyltransferase|nr:glycosyltransferase family protein [Desulfobulbaceae bacterium]
MNAPSFSVIICSINPWKFASCARHYEALLAGFPYEIIGIHDAASLAEGYNRGMARAAGDIFIFSHDDLLILDDHFATKISERLRDYDILGFAGTSRLTPGSWLASGQPCLRGVMAHTSRQRLGLALYGVDEWPVAGGIEAIDGLLMIAQRQAALAVGFDAATFDGFHCYDLDFSFAAHLSGRKIGVVCDMPIIHSSGGDFTGDSWRRYTRLFQQKYAGKLAIAPANIPMKDKLMIINLSDYRVLAEVWNRDSLRRATIALRRRAALAAAS